MLEEHKWVEELLSDQEKDLSQPESHVEDTTVHVILRER